MCCLLVHIAIDDAPNPIVTPASAHAELLKEQDARIAELNAKAPALITVRLPSDYRPITVRLPSDYRPHFAALVNLKHAQHTRRANPILNTHHSHHSHHARHARQSSPSGGFPRG